MPARRLYELTQTRGSPGDGSHVSAIRAFGFTLCLIFRRVGGFRVLIMASTQRTGEKERERERGGENERGRAARGKGRSEKDTRKEKETSCASCIHYGGLTAMAVYAWLTHEEPAASGIRCFIRRREKENGVKSVRAQAGMYFA